MSVPPGEGRPMSREGVLSALIRVTSRQPPSLQAQLNLQPLPQVGEKAN